MATLAAITVAIRANATKFTSAIKKSQRQLKKFAKSTKKASKVVGDLFKKVATTSLIGGGIFVLLSKQSLAAVDNIGKLSTRLGISTRALSEYRLVADKSGLSFQTLALIFQRSTRRISEAAAGIGEARTTLEALGLDAQALNRLSPDRQLEAIADAMLKTGNSADRLRQSVKLFDTEGAGFLQFAKNGSAGIRALRSEARQLGLSLSSDAVRGVERASNAFSELGSLFTGLRDQTISSLAGSFEFLTDKIKNSVLEASKSQGGVEKLGQAIAKSILTTFRSLINGVLKASQVLDSILVKVGLSQEASADKLEQSIKGYSDRINRLRGVIRSALVDPNSLDPSNQIINALDSDRFIRAQEKEIDSLVSRMQEAKTALEAISSAGAGNESIPALESLSTTLGEMIDNIGKSSGATEKLKSSLGGVSLQLNATSEEIKEFNNLQSEGKSLTESLRTPLEIYDDQLFRIHDLYQSLAIDLETYNRAIEANKNELDDALNPDKTKDATDAAKELGLTFSSAFEEAITGGKNLSEVLKGLILDINKIFFRKTVTEPIATSISDFAKGFNILDFLPFGGGRETGGPVFGGQAYLVGERGPELFTPSSSGSITPNNQLNSTINQTFNISGPVDRRSMDQIQAAAASGAQRAMRRNT